MDKLQFVYVSDMRPVVRSQWGFKGTAYGCMNCGFGVTAPAYNYCPNCGAQMSDEVTGKTAPVNVVRCRDCAYYDPEPYGNVPMCYRGLGYTLPDDYCSKAERKEDA